MNVTVKDLPTYVSAISLADIDRTLLSFKVAKETGECTAVEVDEIQSYCELLTNFRRAVSFVDVQNAYDAIEVATRKIQSGNVRPVAEQFRKIVEDKFTEIGNRRPAIEVKNADNRTCDLRDGKDEILLSVLLKIGSEEICPPIENIEITFSWQNQEFCRKFPGKFDVGNEIIIDDLQIPISVLELETGGGVIKTMISYVGYGGDHVNVGPGAVSFSLAYIPVEDVYRNWIDKPADKDIFVGRNAILKDMTDAVEISSGGMGFPICGQRRQGKSSLLDAFARKLDPSKVELTNIDFYGETSFIGSTFRNLVDMFVNEVATHLEKGLLPADWEKLDQYVNKTPKQLMMSFARIVQGRRWCITIDEFTEVYDYYRKKPDARREELISLLKFLKNLVEKKAFHLFVVVQNSYFNFKQDFADLMASLGREKRLTGLTEDDIFALVAKMDPRFLRIKQPEVEKLRTLSGGNPLFLLHLLSMISSAKEPQGAMVAMSSFMITGPVINHAVSLLCDRKKHEKWCLLPMDFQCMFKLGIADLQDEEDVLRIYRLLSGEDACENTFTQKDRKILLALQDRGIVKSSVEGGRYELVIGLFREWLNRYDPEDRLTSKDFIKIP